MPLSAFDLHMMDIALRMAERGLGQTAPNPAVGAVIAEEASGEVIARGWTQPGGRPHAETEAIRRAGARACGATLYVTLEPCAHHGKTPPCADAIIAAGLRRVAVGVGDPDPRTAGQGIARLGEAGIEVVTGVREREARWVTLGHMLRVTQHRPFVELKIATDAAGNVPQAEHGRPAWVTGTEARAFGHLLRARTDAILVGAGTVLADDPQLDCRLPGLAERSPDRVILDGSLRTPATARVLPGSEKTRARVWIASGVDERRRDTSPLWARGALVLKGMRECGSDDIDLPGLLHTLAVNGVTRLLVEGGPRVWRSFAKAGLVDAVWLFQGQGAINPAAAVPQAVLHHWLPGADLRLAESRRIGDDRVYELRRT